MTNELLSLLKNKFVKQTLKNLAKKPIRQTKKKQTKNLGRTSLRIKQQNRKKILFFSHFHFFFPTEPEA